MTRAPLTRLMFLAPALLLYALFVLYPLLSGLSLSFTDFKGIGTANFAGLANYERMLGDPVILNAIKNTLLYALIVVVGQTGLGLALAAALFQLKGIRNFMRVVLFTPSMLSLLVVAYVWAYIYAPLGGLLNEFLPHVGLGALARSWLGDPHTALPAIAFANIWMYVGHATAIFLASYLSIPADLFDSAQIDGASGWQRFRAIDWPLLAPATTINVTFATIGSLKTFEMVFIMAPTSNFTDVLSLQIYNNAFLNNRFGYGAAMAVAMFIATVLISFLLSWHLRRREARL